MNTYSSKDYAKDLVRENIFVINEANPFTWTSGLVMPFYCDQRSILSNVTFRNNVLKGLTEILKKIPNYQSCALVGVVSAGVPWATMLATHLNLPLGYVRSQKKEHGKKNALEGNIEKNMPIILVEDLISTAKSIVAAHTLLKDEGYSIQQGLALFSYGFQSAFTALKEINLSVHTLSNFSELNKQLEKPLRLTAEQKLLFHEH
jgi:orotate phosphoribosyltransferase